MRYAYLEQEDKKAREAATAPMNFGNADHKNAEKPSSVGHSVDDRSNGDFMVGIEPTKSTERPHDFPSENRAQASEAEHQKYKEEWEMLKTAREKSNEQYLARDHIRPTPDNYHEKFAGRSLTCRAFHLNSKSD